MATTMQKYDSQVPETTNDRRWVAPRVDIYENSDEVLLRADLPGVSKDGLNINLDNDQLTIEGTVVEDAPGNVVAREYGAFDYRRSFVIPSGTDVNKISADLKHGVLTLHLPKGDALKPRQIKVTSS